MPRLLLIGCAVALIGLAFVVLPDEGGEPGSFDLLEPGAGGGSLAGSDPRLLSSSTDPATKVGPGRHEEPEPPRRTGPYEFFAVSSETEAPLAGVEIEIEEGERLGATGPDGRLRLEDGGHTELVFRATLAGHLPHRGYALAGEPAAFAMRPGISIGGRVLLAAGSTPVPNAELRVWDVDLEREIASLRSDAEGRFTIPAVRPNRPFLIVTTAEDFVPHRQTENFDVSIRDLEVRVGGGGGLTGTVTDAHGHTVADVEVQLLWPSEPLPAYRPDASFWSDLPGLADARTGRTRTDEDGAFAFVGVRVHEPVQPVVLVAPRFAARGDVVRFEKEEQALESDILIPQPASLRIYVEDDLGRVLRNASVRVLAGNSVWKIQSGDRQRDGSYRLAPVTPGTCQVLASVPNGPGPPDRPKSLTLRAGGEETVHVQFPRGQDLTGRVLNKAGEPVWKAQVGWTCKKPEERAGTTTDMEGRFRLQRLQGSSGAVTVRARDVPYTPLGYEMASLYGVAPGPKPLEITLKDGTRVVGRFPELRPDTQVHATLLPGTSGDARMLWLDKERGFVRRGPRKGGYGRIVFRLHGYAPLVHQVTRPFASEEVRDLGNLYFAVTSPFQGRILDPGRKPIRGAKVTIIENWAQGRSQRTDRDGEFDFARLPEQEIRIRVEVTGLPPNLAVLRMESQLVRQDIVVRDEGTLELTVVDSRHKKAARVEVFIQETEKKKGGRRLLEKKTKTDARGVLKIQLPPGSYKVGVMIRKTRDVGESDFVITAGRTKEILLRLESWYVRYMRQVRKKQKK